MPAMVFEIMGNGRYWEDQGYEWWAGIRAPALDLRRELGEGAADPPPIFEIMRIDLVADFTQTGNGAI
jgi:hypothetical protein